MTELIHISFSKVYVYKGIAFEVDRYIGCPVFLRLKDFEVKESQFNRPLNVPLRWWGLFGQFNKLSNEDKLKYIVN